MNSKNSYNEGCYLFGNYLSVICQNWVILIAEEELKKIYGDEIYLLVTAPYYFIK